MLFVEDNAVILTRRIYAWYAYMNRTHRHHLYLSIFLRAR